MDQALKLNVRHVMQTNKQKNIKILIIAGSIILIIGGVLVLILDQKKQPKLEEELLDPITYFDDQADYKFSINTQIVVGNSPLYNCEANTVPEYLDTLAQQIDTGLEKETESNFVIWTKKQKEIIRYDINTTELKMFLQEYPKKIQFYSIERFVTNYLDSSIKHSRAEIDQGEEYAVYSANRQIYDEEIFTNSLYSDYFLVHNGYLQTARIHLARFEKTKYVVPLIANMDVLENYLRNEKYPKKIILDTTKIVSPSQYTYETFDPEYTYESCLINNIDPVLYFSSCNQNYLYYAYKITGICDITYEDDIYTVPFKGFINAVDPEYVKTLD
jgi:hypothetical protein